MKRLKESKHFKIDDTLKRTGNKSFEEIKKVIEVIRKETLKLEPSNQQSNGRVL